MSIFKKVPCCMLLSPKNSSVVMSILGFHTPLGIPTVQCESKCDKELTNEVNCNSNINTIKQSELYAKIKREPNIENWRKRI